MEPLVDEKSGPPPLVGMYTMFNLVLINDPSLLEAFYVTKNAYFTKHESQRKSGEPLVYNNILNMDTHHAEYAPKRRAVSSAFFKNKV